MPLKINRADFPKAEPNWDIVPKFFRDRELSVSLDKLTARPDLLELVYPVCEEWMRRAHHPGHLYVPDDHPDRNQLGFHKSRADNRMLFGGNQSGKSKAAAFEVKWFLEENHPYQETPKAPHIYVVSANFQTHAQGIYRHLHGGTKADESILSEWEIAGTGPPVEKFPMPRWIKMKKGGIVEFLSAEGGGRARKRFQAAALDLIIIDEEIDEGAYNELLVRCLARGGRIVVSATLVESYEWLLSLEDVAESGDGDHHVFRLSSQRAAEVGHLQAKRFASLFGVMSDENREVRMLGQSRRRQGLIYHEFSAQNHICDPFEVPKDWTRYMAIDPGWHTCAILWAAVSPEGRVYFYRERYLHNMNYREIAREIYTAEGWQPHGTKKQTQGPLSYEKDVWVQVPETEVIHCRLMDPSGFGINTEGGMKLGTLFSSFYGIACAPAVNEVNYGLECVKQGLRMEQTSDGWSDPQFQYFNTLAETFQEIRRYRFHRVGAGDSKANRPVKKRDHAMDAMRYIAAHRPHFIPMEQVVRRGGTSQFKYDETKSAAWNSIQKAEWEMQESERLGFAEDHAGGLGNFY